MTPDLSHPHVSTITLVSSCGDLCCNASTQKDRGGGSCREVEVTSLDYSEWKGSLGYKVRSSRGKKEGRTHSLLSGAGAAYMLPMLL